MTCCSGTNVLIKFGWLGETFGLLLCRSRRQVSLRQGVKFRTSLVDCYHRSTPNSAMPRKQPRAAVALPSSSSPQDKNSSRNYVDNES